MIGGYEVSTQPTDPVILALLQGEHLVPPAPLPPEVFTTREVELIRPALGSADRDWDRLDPDFRQRLLAVFQVMRQQGYELALLEGFRSPERQDYLASLGKHVTSAAAFQSYHQFGLAADCAFYLNGRIIIDEKDPWAMRGYKLYGKAAEAAGLTWGGRWRMMDFGHVELRRPGTLARGK
jgi:peptidoglycan L-alanyl-D-glutamate endopeptidase CwlK